MVAGVNIVKVLWLSVIFVFHTSLLPLSASASITLTLWMSSCTTTMNIFPFLLLPDSSTLSIVCLIYTHSLLWTCTKHLCLDSLSKRSTWAVLWSTLNAVYPSHKSQPMKTLTFSSQWPVFTSLLFLKISQSTLCVNHQTVLMSLVKKPTALPGVSSRLAILCTSWFPTRLPSGKCSPHPFPPFLQIYYYLSFCVSLH